MTDAAPDIYGVTISPLLIVNDLELAKKFYGGFLEMEIVDDSIDSITFRHGNGYLFFEQKMFISESKSETACIRILTDKIKYLYDLANEREMEIVERLHKLPDGSNRFAVCDPFGFTVRIINPPAGYGVQNET